MPDTHGLCAHGKGLDDIGAVAKAAVHQRRRLRTATSTISRRFVARPAVVDEAAAVRDNDAINETRRRRARWSSEDGATSGDGSNDRRAAGWFRAER